MGEPAEISRKGWPQGPWDVEGDRAQFVADGFDCLLQRNRLGGWCGYVGVPEGHPWHGLDYDSIDARVHGGLTWAGENDSHRKPFTDPDAKLWWLGFDTVHLGDVAPGELRYSDALIDRGVYRDERYTYRETELLASQAARVGGYS